MSSPDSKDPAKQNELPVIADCNGCGVCCLHMGYPAYILPRAPMTEAEIAADPDLVSKTNKDPQLLAELLAGREGEIYWQNMPDDLKSEWQAFVDQYQPPEYGGDPETFDGPCIWLDLETRHCKNHEHRPRICRDFETGSKKCYEWRDFYRDRILPT